MYDIDKVTRLIENYHIGTKQSKTIFWYRDKSQKFRTSKVMQYAENGKRDKAKYPFYSHKSADGFELCLYGEHLLKGNNKTVIIVEQTLNGTTLSVNWSCSESSLSTLFIATITKQVKQVRIEIKER